MDRRNISSLEVFDDLPEEEQRRMAAIVDQVRLRDSLRMQNSLVEMCFRDCIVKFRGETLDKQEESCVRACAGRFLAHAVRAGRRFSQLNDYPID